MGVAVVGQARPIGIEKLLLHSVHRKETEADLASDRSSAIDRDFADDVVFGGSASCSADPGALVVLFRARTKNIIGLPRRVGERGEGGRKGVAESIDRLRRRDGVIDRQVAVDLEAACCVARKCYASGAPHADREQQQNGYGQQ